MEVKTTQKEDQYLFISFQQGDKKAFDLFFMKYYRVLCSYANQFVDYDTGEEIVQELMVWLWENKDTVVFESSPLSYLFKAVKNHCLKQIHKNDVRNQILTLLYGQSETLFDDPDFYVVEELSAKIESAIKSLPDTYRQAFEMNRFQDLTYQEIASRLDISPKTVDYRIQQSLKLLRIQLKDYLPLLISLLYHVTKFQADYSRAVRSRVLLPTRMGSRSSAPMWS